MSYQYGTKGGPLHSAQVGGLPRRKVATAYEKVLSGKLESTTVLTVDGSSSHVGAQRPGSNGGYFTVSSDGTWHFDPGSYFYSMAINEERTTSIACTINDGYNDINGAISVTVVYPSYRSQWTPAEISTALWLDASDSPTVVHSDTQISSWMDKSGNGRNATQSVELNKPQYVNMGVRLDTPETLSYDGSFFVASQFSIFVVLQKITGTGLFLVGSGADNSNLHTGWSEPTNFGFKYYGNDWNIPKAQGLNIPLQIAEGQTATYQWVHFDGGIQLTRANSSLLRAYPGSMIGSGYIIHELICLNYTASADLIAKMQGHLAHKWDALLNMTTLVNALPSDHPYKSAAPTL